MTVDTRLRRTILYPHSSTTWFSFDAPVSSDFDHLAATWHEHPTGTACAAVADSYRKRNQLAEASALALQCVERWPEFLPGHLVLARVRRDTGEFPGAERALLAALATDPAHPVVLRELAALADARGNVADGKAWRQLGEAAAEPNPVGLPAFLAGPAFMGDEPDSASDDARLDEDPGDPGEEVFTESLAALYQAQGHLERAAEVYSVLAERTPHNAVLASRRDALIGDIARQRPRPYDSRVSGGAAVGQWLRGIAVTPARRRPEPEAGYDAFFRSAPTREAPEDFEAFQNWLKGLGR